MTADTRYEISCQCGRVRARFTDPAAELFHCYCTDCRKSHGSAFGSSFEVKKPSFSFVQGEKELQCYTAESGTQRWFCRTCGSNMVCTVESDPNSYYVECGVLDTPYRPQKQTHIFVRSKLPWFEIRDDFPQHAAYPASGS